MTLTVHPSVFKGGGQPGDFGWMLTQSAYDTAFIIFNDNEGQFLDFFRDPSATSGAACAQGGGNAVVRPYQCMDPPRAGGVPTGSFDIWTEAHKNGYPALTDAVKGYIDDAIALIAGRIAAHGYTEVYYASDGHGGLGTNIFSPAKEVTDYIVGEIESLPAKVAALKTSP